VFDVGSFNKKVLSIKNTKIFDDFFIDIDEMKYLIICGKCPKKYDFRK